MKALQLAWRRLIRTPGFSLLAVLSLSLGASVSVAAYSIVASVLWSGGTVLDEERTAFVSRPIVTTNVWRSPFSWSHASALLEEQQSLRPIAASSRRFRLIDTGSGSVPAPVEAVTGDYFSVAGLEPSLGRTLGRSDDDNPQPVVVVSHSYWRAKLGGRSDVLGQVIQIGRKPFVIVGVAHKEFQGVALGDPEGTSAWIPASLEFGPAAPTDAPLWTVVGRLRDDLTLPAASSEIAHLGNLLQTSAPQTKVVRTPASSAPWGLLSFQQASSEGMSSISRVGVLVIIITSSLFLVACTNLVSLVRTRAQSRQHNLDINWALGATRWHLFREAAAEGMILVGVSVAFTAVLSRVFLQLASVDLPIARGRVVQVSATMSPLALGVLSILLIVVILVLALRQVDALRRHNAVPGLKAASAPVRRLSWRLVRWQIAVSTALFLIATPFIGALVRDGNHDPGVDIDHLVVGLRDIRGTGDRGALGLVEGLSGRINLVAEASGLPFGVNAEQATAVRASTDQLSERVAATGVLIAATPNIFKTLGIPIVQGRGFADHDKAGSVPVVVVSRQVAHRLFGEAPAIGQFLTLTRAGSQSGESVAIVGVTEDTDTVRSPSRNGGAFYRPASQMPDRALGVVVGRTNETASAADVSDFRALLGAGGADVESLRVGTGRSMMAGQQVLIGIAASVGTSLAAVTLVLVAIGLYATMSGLARSRTTEFGLRLAIGATPRSISELLLREGMLPVIQGLGASLLMAVGARVGLGYILAVPFSTFDWEMGAVSVLVLSVSGLACLQPARLGASTNPIEALRDINV